MHHFHDRIFSIESQQQFNELALDICQYQHSQNPIYRKWVNHLYGQDYLPSNFQEIPFLPIEFFKTHEVKTGQFEPAITFTSSGTTGKQTSRHFLSSASTYESSFRTFFENLYGRDWCILGLLPSYLEREGSSLIYMVDDLIQNSVDSRSGFFLQDHEKLHALIRDLESEGRKTLLIGVTYALMDFFESYPIELKHTLVMETGGMKGRRRELTRNEVHDFLRRKSGAAHIHSEYGMTELLSQAYSKGQGLFECPPWMKVQIRNTENPKERSELGKTGGINVIDLANFESCSFIATQDLGRLHSDGKFEVLGRFDNSDVRGCSLLIE